MVVTYNDSVELQSIKPNNDVRLSSVKMNTGDGFIESKSEKGCDKLRTMKVDAGIWYYVCILIFGSLEERSTMSKEVFNVPVQQTGANLRSPEGTSGVVNTGKQTNKMKTSKTTIGILFTVAAVFLVGGIIVGLCWMGIFNSILFKELILTPTSTSYQMWKETPIPMYLKLYLYNWTNTQEFSSTSTTKPNFVELGPYTFREVHTKVNQTWNENGTITFQQRRIWHFEESMSNGSLDDEITNLNVIGVTVGHAVRHELALIRIVVNGMLVRYQETLFVTKTARELLFDGYDSEFLDFVRNLNISTFEIPFDKFGWFYGRNGSDTYDGVFNMHTGEHNISNLGVLDQWKYNNRTDFWSGECDTIRGTTGELWPPVPRDESVEIFAPDICTSLKLTRANDTNLLGVTGHTFSANEATFDNGTNVPDRACYCIDDACQASGVLNVSACRFGAPAFVSLPHFYLADDSYANAISGMEPRDDEHNFMITLEPVTGIPLSVSAKMQINIFVQPVEDITMLTNISSTYVPMLWFSQEAELTDNYSRQIKFLLTLPTLGHATSIAVAGIGVLLVLIAIYLWVRRSRQGEETQSLIVTDDPSNTSRNVPITS